MKTAQNRPYDRLTPEDALVLFIDHQAGLTSLVRDQSPTEFHNNVLALADTALLFDLPVILTTSFERGPNGPLLPELRDRFPRAPYIARPGEINAWDNPDFVQLVRASGRRQLIVAGIVTDVCVAFPVLSALQEGFQVFAVTDASGTFDESVRDVALMRMALAGAELINWFAVASELMVDWRRDTPGLARLLAQHLPQYAALIASHDARG